MVHLQPSGESGLRLAVSMIVLATLAVAVRLFARSKIIAALAIEDALIVLALCLFGVDQGLLLTGVIAIISA